MNGQSICKWLAYQKSLHKDGQRGFKYSLSVAVVHCWFDFYFDMNNHLLCLLWTLLIVPAFSRTPHVTKNGTFPHKVQLFKSGNDDITPVFSRDNFVLDDYCDRAIETDAENLRGQALVDYVNNRQNLWTARLNKNFESYPKPAVQKPIRARSVASMKTPKHVSETRFLDIDLPKNFDSRIHWPQCDSIKQIRDQSTCGSCWAFGSVSAMSDRICIASKGKIQVTLSANDLLSCCYACGRGCHGGNSLRAWQYWVTDGIVTGSNYTLKQGCKPYPFPPCEHYNNRTNLPTCGEEFSTTPKCENACQDGYAIEYEQDKFYGKSAYSVHASVEAIQKEIYTHGPVEVGYLIYEDFMYYANGIYTHQGGKFIYGHYVKLIGWGEEAGIPYWIASNSYNNNWGDNGFFKILRGVNECDIESEIVAGLPDIDRYDFGNDNDDELH